LAWACWAAPDDRWHHVGRFDELEEQQTDWVPDESDYSPDRIDALVWCAHELKIIGGGWSAAYGIVYCGSCGRGFMFQSAPLSALRHPLREAVEGG